MNNKYTKGYPHPICKAIGCSGMGKECYEKPKQCEIVRKVIKKAVKK